jgi:hypothetical protein
MNRSLRTESGISYHQAEIPECYTHVKTDLPRDLQIAAHGLLMAASKLL